MTGVVAALAGGMGVLVNLSTTDITASGPGATIVTSEVIVSVIGGAASSWAWSKTSGGSIVANSALSPLTSFTGTVPSPGGMETATFVCNVIVNGISYASPILTVTVNRL